ncbi:AbrB/MazE/SpoVT family DNA-binding domain-containing protein [Clostridium sp. UBA3061]|uniref:AbrB/MazE/SpoVT family DNA-binding domain-containing protein n=1 Tax=Clostridium sp. UBA3061 TaxID=1946353 RepID=UPI003217E4B6
MKSTGIVRKIDPLGRIVLPKELRNIFDIQEGTPMEVYTDGDSIVLKKHQIKCALCGNEENLEDYIGTKICEACLEDIRTMPKRKIRK